MQIIVRLGNSFGPTHFQNQNVQKFVIRFNLYNLDFFFWFPQVCFDYKSV